jgi:hypothetical protein
VVRREGAAQKPDGTTHFTHVHYTAHDSSGAPLTVAIARCVTPELGELLCILRNNIDAIIEAFAEIGEAIGRAGRANLFDVRLAMTADPQVPGTLVQCASFVS